MANLQEISTGMAQGPEAINADLNAINAELEGVRGGLKWTDWTNEGITYFNGFKDTGTKYRYATLGNVKLVELNLIVALDTAPAGKPAKVAQLPASISSEFNAEHAESDGYQWIYNSTEFFINVLGANNWWCGKDSHYQMHMLYTHNN